MCTFSVNNNCNYACLLPNRYDNNNIIANTLKAIVQSRNTRSFTKIQALSCSSMKLMYTLHGAICKNDPHFLVSTFLAAPLQVHDSDD